MRLSEPSDRNFEIFYQVEHGSMSLRDAAAKWQLSPGRIQQVVDQVRSWYREMPSDGLDTDPVARAMHGFRLLEERLSYMSSEVMAAWRASQTEITTRREQSSKSGSATLTTVRSFGQVRYLAMAIRLAEARCNAGVRHAQFRQKFGRCATAPIIDPPAGGYAPQDEVEEEVTPEAAETVAASDGEETTCATSQQFEVAINPAALSIPNPMRSRLSKKLARHEKRKAARQRKQARQLA